MEYTNNMTEIYLVRHPETEHNANPDIVSGRSNSVNLTPRGFEQARQFSQAFVETYPTPDAVYSSPALRTQTLAQIYTEQNNIPPPIAIDDDLQEMSQGVAGGKNRLLIYTPDVIERINQELFDFKLPGGESLNDVSTRLLGWVWRMHVAHPEQTVVAFTHGQAIRSAVGALLGWSHYEVTRDPSKQTPNVSVSHLSVHDDTITVNYMGRVIIPQEES